MTEGLGDLDGKAEMGWVPRAGGGVDSTVAASQTVSFCVQKTR